MLLATNPGRPLPALHGRAASQEAAQKCGGKRVAAHVFAVAEQSARSAEQGDSASVCVIGESGSGKTEVAKLLLLHWLRRYSAAQPRPSSMPPFLEAVVLGRCAIESFGHAATPANSNATRVILLTRLQLLARLRAAGGSGSGRVLGVRFEAALVDAARAATGARVNFITRTPLRTPLGHPAPPVFRCSAA